MMSSKNTFYQIEKEVFDWVYAQVIDETPSHLECKILSSQEKIRIPKGNQREIQINRSFLEQLGVKNGRLNHIYILPTYHFFGTDFKGCCNPVFGLQVFPKADYETISSQMDSLLNAAKDYYSFPIDLYYDKAEFIRKRLNCVYNINQLFDRLEQLGLPVLDKIEIVTKAEAKPSNEGVHF